jgi:hypothetical protein
VVGRILSVNCMYYIITCRRLYKNLTFFYMPIWIAAELKPDKKHAGATLEIPSEDILKTV